MKDLWWLEIVGFILLLNGAWRLLWRFPLIIGLLGANKLGTAKGDQIDENKKNVEEMKKGLPLALFMLILGGVLVYFF